LDNEQEARILTDEEFCEIEHAKHMAWLAEQPSADERRETKRVARDALKSAVQNALHSGEEHAMVVPCDSGFTLGFYTQAVK
jgi:hypothetical protein